MADQDDPATVSKFFKVFGLGTDTVCSDNSTCRKKQVVAH